MHILIFPGSYTKGDTLHKLFTVLHLGELPILICTKREKEMEGREKGNVRGRMGRQRKERELEIAIYQWKHGEYTQNY